MSSLMRPVMESMFVRNRCDVLATSGDDEFLDATGDGKHVRLRVDGADVAAVQPRVFVDAFLGLRQVVEVTHHDVTATEANLTFAILVAPLDLVELDLDARNRHAARTGFEVIRLAHILRTSVFGHTVNFENVDADRAEVVERVLHDRRSAREAYSRLIETDSGVSLLHELHREAAHELVADGGSDLRRRVHARALT